MFKLINVKKIQKMGAPRMDVYWELLGRFVLLGVYYVETTKKFHTTLV